ncbi:hypothetical protein GCM10027341_27260 [Spirosoma knui]
MGHYAQNQFANLLRTHLGNDRADQLLHRFHIGTSARWPGACVFWLIDEQGRKRGGQIKLFGSDWHTVKYQDATGRTRAKVDWVHTALKRRYQQRQTPIPDWLNTYVLQSDYSPCLFGVHQLASAPGDQPIAIVEAPKTAVLCSGYFPQFIWLATMARSYLQPNRLNPLRGRNILLFPDLSQNGKDYAFWQEKAKLFQQEGFNVHVSDFLERRATDEDRISGLDLADFLLRQPVVVSTLTDYLAQPSSILRPDQSALVPLAVTPCADYPAAWDVPDPVQATPTLKALSFHQWQQRNQWFSQLGLTS